MEDSQTRRSSIPILKQTNKTKSFQSFVSLNLSDDVINQQKGRSPPSTSSISSISSISPPIAENIRIPPKFLPRSTSMHASHLEIDNDIIITKLCEENKRLKEHQTQLISKFEEAVRENMEIQNKNDELQKELSRQRKEMADKIILQKQCENLQKQQQETLDKNKKLQRKLEEILPESIKTREESREKSQNSSNADLHNIMNELESLKSYLNNVELQLYEANEHISELIEKNQEMEIENLNLKSENAKIKNLSKIIQDDMFEKLNASKRREESLVRVKSEHRELIQENIEGGESSMIDEIANLKTEISRQKKAYEAQFIEYV